VTAPGHLPRQRTFSVLHDIEFEVEEISNNGTPEQVEDMLEILGHAQDKLSEICDTIDQNGMNEDDDDGG
jgi:hypothetical protein